MGKGNERIGLHEITEIAVQKLVWRTFRKRQIVAAREAAVSARLTAVFTSKLEHGAVKTYVANPNDPIESLPAGTNHLSMASESRRCKNDPRPRFIDMYCWLIVIVCLCISKLNNLVTSKTLLALCSYQKKTSGCFFGI